MLFIYIVQLYLGGTKNFKGPSGTTEEAEGAANPRMSVTDENAIDVKKVPDEDRRMTYQYINETLGLNVWVIRKILHDHLNVKFCCLWVAHAVTEE